MGESLFKGLGTPLAKFLLTLLPRNPKRREKEKEGFLGGFGSLPTRETLELVISRMVTKKIFMTNMTPHGYFLSLFYGMPILYISNMHALYSYEILYKYCELYLLGKGSV